MIPNLATHHICLKLTINDVMLVSLLLTLNRFQVNTSWVENFVKHRRSVLEKLYQASKMELFANENHLQFKSVGIRVVYKPSGGIILGVISGTE